MRLDGSIDSAMMAAINANPAAMQTAMSRTPLKRLGAPKEVGDVVAFLASDTASYITGETIYVDGGRLALNYTCRKRPIDMPSPAPGQLARRASGWGGARQPCGRSAAPADSETSRMPSEARSESDVSWRKSWTPTIA
jgi:hypothetical protein